MGRFALLARPQGFRGMAHVCVATLRRRRAAACEFFLQLRCASSGSTLKNSRVRYTDRLDISSSYHAAIAADL